MNSYDATPVSTEPQPQLSPTAPVLIVATSDSPPPELAWLGDCACPGRLSASTEPPARSHPSTLHQAATAFTSPLPADFHLVLSPTAPAGPGVLNRAGWERWQEFRAPQPLRSAFDQALAEQSLLHPLDAPPALGSDEVTALTVWLHVTNACNLDCPYCYVHKSTKMLGAADSRRALEAVFHTAQLHRLARVTLKYAGGEATLHVRRIRELHDQAVRLATRLGIQLDEVILTNGTLLRSQDADWCAEENVRIMISLDGMGALHDRLRSWPDGRGTFAQVQRTVDVLLRPRGIRPHISMTVTGLNAGGAPDVAQWAVVERRLPLNFNFYRAHAPTVAPGDLVGEERAVVAGLLAACAVIEDDLPTEPLLGGLLDRAQLFPHRYACGAGRNYAVISHDGRLAHCHMRLDETQPLQGEDDLLALTAHGALRNLAVDEKEGCRDCAFRHLCAGGCPLETYRATGRWDLRSPNCAIVRQVLPAMLRLEGLRLLKVNGYLH